MEVGGPIPLVKSRFGVRETGSGQIVGQCVDPDIHHVRRIARHRNAPVEGRPRDRQITQPAGDEADDLVAAHLGRDEVGILGIVRQQWLRVGREPEKIGLLLGPGDRGVRLGRHPGAVGIDLCLSLGKEPFVAHRVPPGIGIEVDVAAISHSLPDRRRCRVVIFVGGADESVEGDVEQFLQTLEPIRVAAGEIRGW